jgi:predicted transcriptional regulator
VPLDQWPPDRSLQAASVLRHRALAEVEVRRGALEAAAIRNGHEAAQRGDVQHGTHVDKSSRLSYHDA